MTPPILVPYPGSAHTKRRRGRGSSRGNYSGRGMKGQRARTGSRSRAAFEGGQTPLVRRMPKLKGFKNFNKVVYHPLNLGQLNVFTEGDSVDPQSLLKKGMVKRKTKIKLLGTGDLKVKLSITVHAASESAKKKLEELGVELKLLDHV